jgi:lambda family phage portal protein
LIAEAARRKRRALIRGESEHRVEVRRVEAEKHQKALELKRVYAAAEVTRLTQDWFTSILSADQEIKGDHRRLVGASRALTRDNPYASRFCRQVAENTIGHQGIQLQMRVMTTRNKPAERVNRKVEHEWLAWCRDPMAADASGRMSFVETQQLVASSLPRDGEFLVRHIRGADNPWAYAVQVLDTDLLDVELGNSTPVRLPNGNLIVMGVEMESQFLRPVAYWLWTEHPSEHGQQARRRTRIPRDELEHKYIVLRAGQTRGVPWFAPVLIGTNMLGAYEEAAVNAARVGAASMAAVTTDPDKAVTGTNAVAGADAIPQVVEPGRLFRLNPGEALSPLPFDYPSGEFAPFTKAILRSIAVGLNVSYTSLSGDLEAVNYSSIRAGLLAERDFYRGLQQWFVTHLLRPVFREWVQYAALAGRIAARDVEQYLASATWKPRGWQWVDPLNDVQAAEKEIQLGLNSRSNINGDRGRDFEEIVDDLDAENQYAVSKRVQIAVGKPAPESQDRPPEEPVNDTSKLRLARSLG